VEEWLVAIFIKNNIDSKEIIIRTHLEAIVTLVKLDKPIHICNIYSLDSSPFTTPDIENILDQLPKPYIILGDFNSRNTSCGCNLTDLHGKTIEQIIENDQSLIVLNNGDPTRYNSSKFRSKVKILYMILLLNGTLKSKLETIC